MLVIQNQIKTQIRHQSPENHHHSDEFFALHPEHNLDAKHDE